MTEASAGQAAQLPPSQATIADLMRPPLTTMEPADHAAADGKDLNAVRIHDLMTADPTIINTAASIRYAAIIMTHGHFRHLPVTSNSGLVGMVDITDICRALIGLAPFEEKET